MDQGPTCRVCHGALRQPAVDGVCADCLRTPHTDGASATATTRGFDTPLPSDEALTRTAPPVLVPAPRPAFEAAVAEYLRSKHYRDPKKVAAGGYGTVYEATNSVGRRVAVKVLHPHLASELIKSRFETEAVALSELDHSGLVKFYHYEPDAEAPFLVTEFVPGGTLAQSVKAGGPLPPKEAAGLLAEVATVVQYLHDRPVPVIHRDLKPSNILLDENGRPKVADFGLAKRLGEADKQRTRSISSVGGTPEYCAPEQFRPGAKTDGRSDVYALGATLFAVLVGEPPFVRDPDDDHCQKLIKVIDTTPPPPLPADVPADLAMVCRKCLEKHPDDRYQSAAEVAAVLGRVAQGLPVKVRPVREWVTRRWRAAKRAPLGKKLTAAVVTLLATAGLAAAVFHQPPLPPPPPEPDPNDVAADALDREEKIDLIEKGWPRFQTPVLGSGKLTPMENRDKTGHVATVDARDHTVILLTQKPLNERYKLTVRLCQEEQARDMSGPVARVGVALDYQQQKVGGKLLTHGLTVFQFPEYAPGTAVPQNVAEFGELAVLDPSIERQNPSAIQGPQVTLPLYTGDTKPVRTLVLKVTPEGVTAQIDKAGPVSYPLKEIVARRDDADNGLGQALARRPGPALPNVASRPWTPRGPIGVYARHSTLTVHSFVIEPLPPE